MAATEKPQVEIPDHSPSYQLELEDLVVGDGDEATPGKIVEVHYVGVSWSTGRQFDASWDRGDTFKFGLGKGQVIQGWDEGVQGMKVGGRRRITIPPHLRAYAGLDKDCVGVGAMNRVEVWDAAAGQSYSDEQETAFAEMNDEVFPGL